jgi:branched-chain amino acid transport system permease protein
MEKLLQLLLSGVALGSIYALLALGFVIIFKATHVVNFAHAGLLMVGTYCVARLRTDGELPFAVAVLLGIAVAAVVALVVERVLVRPVVQRSVVAVAIMTIGVDVVMQTEITRRLGIDIVPVGDPWQSATVDVLGVTVPQTRVAALVVALVVLGGFFAWSLLGLGHAMRASAENTTPPSSWGSGSGACRRSSGSSPLCWQWWPACSSPARPRASRRRRPPPHCAPAAILGGSTPPAGRWWAASSSAGGDLTQGYQDQLVPRAGLLGGHALRGDGRRPAGPPTGLFGATEATRV